MIEDATFLAKLTEWTQVSATLDAAKAREMELRKELFGFAFPTPLEGTNKAELPGNWMLKGVYKLNRDLDLTALAAVNEEMVKLQVNPDTLVKYKPELITGAYKALSDQARLVYDQALIVKVGSPSLELVAPKETKG